MKTKIGVLVEKYLAAHPNFLYPESGDRHPSILAVGDQMQLWLVDALGGVDQYWRAMLASAREWFEYDGAQQTREFRLFCYCFEAMGNVSGNGAPEVEALNRLYQDWRRSKNPKFAPEVE